MAWPYTPLTTYIPAGVPAIKALDLNKLQSFINGWVSMHDAEIFGDGSDGAATVSTTIGLSRDMFYTTLTVTGSGTIQTNGYAIYATQSITVNGVVDGSGAAASGQYGGFNSGPHAMNGTTASRTTVAVYPQSYTGIGGLNSGQGGNGGNGSGGTYTGSASPLINGPTNFYKIAPFRFTNIQYQTAVGFPVSTTLDFMRGGSCGGAGGGDNTNFGGGGGAGAAAIYCIAPSVTIGAVGSFVSNGGAGGAGHGGNAGGGGGGGGGGVVIVSRTYSSLRAGALLIVATGGLGGIKFGAGTGTAGTAGSAGLTTPILVTLPAWPT